MNRDDFRQITTVKDALYWLCDLSGYEIGYFGGEIGYGLLAIRGGGCYGVIVPNVLTEMLERKLVLRLLDAYSPGRYVITRAAKKLYWSEMTP